MSCREKEILNKSLLNLSNNTMKPRTNGWVKKKLLVLELTLTQQMPVLPLFRNQLTGFYMTATLAINELRSQ